MEPQYLKWAIDQFIRSLLAIALAVVVGLGVWNIDVLHRLFRKTPEMLSNLSEVQVAGVKIGFGQKGFSLNKDIARLSEDDRAKVLRDLHGLSPEEFSRLLHLTEYDIAHVSNDDIRCDYDHATAEMRLYSAADHGLKEKGLVEFAIKPELTARVREAAKKIEAKNGGKPLEIGTPSNCYQMTLTDAGRNLKSMIVAELKRAFGPNADGK